MKEQIAFAGTLPYAHLDASGGTIDVWRIDLDQPFAGVPDPAVFLVPEEIQRAERFIFARDAHRSRRCRAMLRLGLAWYLGKPPREIALATGWQGKPRLAGTHSLHFNVTHSAGAALIAFTAAGEVGVDLEALDRTVESLDIADRFFTRKESSLVAAAKTQQEQAAVFLRFWTRKEAILKAAGPGLTQGLDTIDVSAERPEIIALSGSDAAGPSHWQVHDLLGIEGFAAAVAAPPGAWMATIQPMRADTLVAGLASRFPGMF